MDTQTHTVSVQERAEDCGAQFVDVACTCGYEGTDSTGRGCWQEGHNVPAQVEEGHWALALPLLNVPSRPPRPPGAERQDTMEINPTSPRWGATRKAIVSAYQGGRGVTNSALLRVLDALVQEERAAEQAQQDEWEEYCDQQEEKRGWARQ